MREVSLYNTQKKNNENTNNNNVLQPVVTKIEVPSVSFFPSLYFYFYTLLPVSRWILLHPVLLCNDNVLWIILLNNYIYGKGFFRNGRCDVCQKMKKKRISHKPNARFRVSVTFQIYSTWIKICVFGRVTIMYACYWLAIAI